MRAANVCRSLLCARDSSPASSSARRSSLQRRQEGGTRGRRRRRHGPAGPIIAAACCCRMAFIPLQVASGAARCASAGRSRAGAPASSGGGPAAHARPPPAPTERAPARPHASARCPPALLWRGATHSCGAAAEEGQARSSAATAGRGVTSPGSAHTGTQTKEAAPSCPCSWCRSARAWMLQPRQRRAGAGSGREGPRSRAVHNKKQAKRTAAPCALHGRCAAVPKRPGDQAGVAGGPEGGGALAAKVRGDEHGPRAGAQRQRHPTRREGAQNGVKVGGRAGRPGGAWPFHT